MTDGSATIMNMCTTLNALLLSCRVKHHIHCWVHILICNVCAYVFCQYVKKLYYKLRQALGNPFSKCFEPFKSQVFTHLQRKCKIIHISKHELLSRLRYSYTIYPFWNKYPTGHVIFVSATRFKLCFSCCLLLISIICILVFHPSFVYTRELKMLLMQFLIPQRLFTSVLL